MNWVPSSKHSKSHHWLLITSRTTWSYLQNRKEWAFARQSRPHPEAIHAGDNAIIYLRAEGVPGASAIGGAVDFIGKPWGTDGRLLFDELFPIRIAINPTRVVNPPVPFGPIIDHLEFIKNKRNWMSHLQGYAALRLSEKDFDYLISCMERFSPTLDS